MLSNAERRWSLVIVLCAALLFILLCYGVKIRRTRTPCSRRNLILPIWDFKLPKSSTAVRVVGERSASEQLTCFCGAFLHLRSSNVNKLQCILTHLKPPTCKPQAMASVFISQGEPTRCSHGKGSNFFIFSWVLLQLHCFYILPQWTSLLQKCTVVSRLPFGKFSTWSSIEFTFKIFIFYPLWMIFSPSPVREELPLPSYILPQRKWREAKNIDLSGV